MTTNLCACGCSFDWEAPMITDNYWDDQFKESHSPRTTVIKDLESKKGSGFVGSVGLDCPARCSHVLCISEWEFAR